MGENKEALVVCSDESRKIGVTIWDVKEGDQLLRIPSCASSPHGVLCCLDRYLVASQYNTYGSLGEGVILVWQLDKPRRPPPFYTMEAIGPIACTKDDRYLVGGALSGNAYLWEVPDNGILHCKWQAHNKSMTCMAFADSDSLLISGSEDGQICIWSMSSLLEMGYSKGVNPLLLYSFDHKSSISGLQTMPMSGHRRSIFMSSSLDGTCKLWDTSGRLLQTRVFPLALTALVLDPAEQTLFLGSADGTIFVNPLVIDIEEDPFTFGSFELEGHNGAITALTMSASGLISASEDKTVCIWDVTKWVMIRRFDHAKGRVTNLVVIPRSLLSPEYHNQKAPNQPCISLLDKFPQVPLLDKVAQPLLDNVPQPSDDNLTQQHSSPKRMTALNRSCVSNNKIKFSNLVQRAEIPINRYTSELQEREQQEVTPVTMKLKLDKSVKCRTMATGMAKHINEMDEHLQSRLQDLTQYRMECRRQTDSASRPNKKKLKM